jgi:outer membrane cobalamin receptor
MESKYSFDWGFTPYVSLVYVADQYHYEKRVSPHVDPGKRKLDDYMVINLKLNYKTFQDKLTLYVGADNLLDKYYEQSYGYPLAGRTIYGGGEWRFQLR